MAFPHPYSNTIDMQAFARDHASQILATIGLVTFALVKKKLTPLGTLAAGLTAVIHMLDPFPVFFWLLVPFFLLGVLVTKIGHKAKAHITKSSTGLHGGEGTRGVMQVIANSGFASVMIILHIYLNNCDCTMSSPVKIYWYAHESSKLMIALPLGIIAHYAAVAADTFGSELGILAKTKPFLITAPWKQVAPGTNGGVTIDGLVFGLLASLLMTVIGTAGLYIGTPHYLLSKPELVLVCSMGLFGSVVDSFLGATLQATVVEKESGKVVEGPGGRRVKVEKGGSRQQTGLDLLTNNGVNLAMAVIASLSAIGVAFVLDLGPSGPFA